MPGSAGRERGLPTPSSLEPRTVLAPNPGPFTLDGTRTYVVGRERVAIIDPGPDLEPHVQAVLDAVAGARVVGILLTHGHRDHADAARSLAAETEAPVLGQAAGADRWLAAGDAVDTDAGPLTAVETPGHSPDHLVFHWSAGEAVFAGDLVLGAGDTTLVASPNGSVADYLESLARVERLEARRIFPGHGPPIEDAASVLARFAEHRNMRVRQVAEALESRPGATPAQLAQAIYPGPLSDAVRAAAERSVVAILEYLRKR